MIYFAYGSNMLLQRVRESDRTPSAEVVGLAELPHHQLTFYKRGRDGSGKCHAAPSGGEDVVVHGVAYRVPKDEILALDRIEGAGGGYDRDPVEIVVGDLIVSAWTYRAELDHVDPDLQPFHWYKALVVHGARQHGLPDWYVRRIEAIASVPDPDPDRVRLANSLLGATS